jgi:type II secretory pathway component GspD/PulD (secretin)
MKITQNISIKPFQESEMITRFEHKTLKYVKCACLAAIAIMAAVALPAQAADAPAADQAAPAPAPIVEQPVASARPATASSASDILSVTFQKDTSIRDALRYLAAKYQKNIIPSSKVDGALTVSTLYDVTFDEAMKAILGNSFRYEQNGNFIYVYGADEYKKIKEDPDRLETKVFTLYYISAAEAIKLLAPVVSSASVMQASSPAEKVAPTGGAISAGSGGGDSMALNDMIVIKDYPERLAMVAKKLKELDVRPLQVLVEATILSVTLTENTQFGIDWNTLGGVAISGVVSTATTGGASTSGFAPSPTSKLTIGITSDPVSAVITALETTNDITVMANPKILAINKQLGQVYIGSKLGYRDQTTTGTDGTTIAGAVSFLETGTKLAFRPYIGNDGYIRMDIQPKDSTGSLDAQGIPSETSAELATNIMVKDGQTVVIGGLLRTKTTISKSQIPILGDIPVVGILFRGTNDKTERQEVVVMLTPHIIKSPCDIPADEAKADMANLLEGARKEMQWFSRSRIAEDHYQSALKAYNSGNMRTALFEVRFALEFRPSYTEALRLEKLILSQSDKKADNTSMEKVMQTL